MINGLNKKNNLLIQEYFKKICAPLFSNFPISSFSYLKYNKDSYNFISSLCNDNFEILNYFYFNNPFTLEALQKIKNQNIYIYSWKADKFIEKNTTSDQTELKVDNVYNILKRSEEGGIKIYSFGTSTKFSQMKDFYANYTDVLERFIFYFNNKFSDISLPNIKLPESFNFNVDKSISEYYSSFITFINNTQLHKYWIRDLEGKKVNLSNRQIECLYYYNKGRSAKEIAKILNISYRTVEVHLSNLKLKMNTSMRTETVNYLPSGINSFIETEMKYRKIFELHK